MNENRFINIALVVLGIIFIGAAVYFVFGKTPLSFFPSFSDSADDEAAITFLSPKDGEQISMGSGTYTIQWPTNNAQYKDKKVSLYAITGMNNPVSASVQFNIGTTDFNAGSYPWTLPKGDVGFATHFIYPVRSEASHGVNANRPVKLAMEISPPDSQTQPDIMYSGAIHFTPIPVSAKFTFPAGGERFTIGKPRVITWDLPINIKVSDVVLSLKPVIERKVRPHVAQGKSDPLHEEPYLSNEIRSYSWDGKTIHSSGHGHNLVPTNVKPGKYSLHLGFRTEDGYYQGIDSEQFELVSF